MSSAPRRKSKGGILRRPSLSPLTRIHDDSDGSNSPRAAKRHRPSFLSSQPSLSRGDTEGESAVAGEEPGTPPQPHGTRPTAQRKGRPSSLFGSLRNLRLNDEDTPPATASSSKAPSLNWKDFGFHSVLTDIGRDNKVLHHSEAHTHSAFWFKKKVYLVLTEGHIVQFKNQTKASELFHRQDGFHSFNLKTHSSKRDKSSAITSLTRLSIPHPHSNKTGLIRHTSSPSAGSSKNDNTSDISGDKADAIPLDQVIAVYLVDDARNNQSVEIAYLDSEAGQGSTVNFQFCDSEEAQLWMKSIRQSADSVRLANFEPIPPRLSEYAARVVEREKDYDISTYRIFKVAVRRTSSRSLSRSSIDDFNRTTASIRFLAIGTHLVHLIVLPKNLSRVSTPSINEVSESDNYGILSMTAVIVSSSDDGFSLCFRCPFQPPCVLDLASLASHEIALRLRQVENFLRPSWATRPYMFEIPSRVEETFSLDDPPPDDNLDPFDRTMIAYCVAYKVNPTSIRYRVDDGDYVEDAPRFQLVDSDPNVHTQYNELQLLAVLRSLRFNESYGTVSFSGISLNCLNQKRDLCGSEHVCDQSVHGLPLKLSIGEQQNASLLVQEIRALALSTRRLRRLDFSFCVSHQPSTPSLANPTPSPGCGIVESLFPLFKKQATNIDWIALNGIELQETDLDYLVSIAAEKAAHFRAVEASRCHLTDRGLALLLDVFKTHENTLEALDISNNPLRLVPSIVSSQLSFFPMIRKLNLSNLPVTSSTEPLIPFPILSQWRLDTLHLSGIPLNKQTVLTLCEYISLDQSLTLRELWLCNCGLSGEDAANLMESMDIESTAARLCHLNISENPLYKKPDKMVSAIARSCSPTQLSLRSIEYDIEQVFEELLLALASNKATRVLDIARTSLPAEASEGVCKALEMLLADNQTIEDLDISGEETRLETSKLGVGINQAFHGLKKNKTLQVLRVQFQKLGLQGASTLAEVLELNNTLRELHCDFNAINLTAFTNLVNSLQRNMSILFLPPFHEGRDNQVRETEEEIRAARNKSDGSALSNTTSRLTSWRRAFTNINTNTLPGASNSKALSKNKIGDVPQWREKDIQQALSILTGGWEKQANRLNKYLARNWRIMHGIPEPEEDKTASPKSDMSMESQRPGTAGSIGKILERVAADITPTVEKDVQLGDAALGTIEVENGGVASGSVSDSEKDAVTAGNENGSAPGAKAATEKRIGDGALERAPESPETPTATFGDLPISDLSFLKENIFQPGSPQVKSAPVTPEMKQKGFRGSTGSSPGQPGLEDSGSGAA